ncbi:hypothetical protein [Kitasatospora mediocidica]|uniref:hypothetical protein n=1 Tax=Kitasatospora mediocidica TaxID=58352 RepID=UPI00055B16D1|nr:hypothetical protein [Kitasatospora mediocidica]
MPIRRSPLRTLPAALVLTATAALTGCSASTPASHPTPTDPASATALPPVSASDTSPDAVAAANAQLSAEILTTPTGGRAFSGIDAHTGVLTLDDFINEFWSANPPSLRIKETGLAETRGFVTADRSAAQDLLKRQVDALGH